MALSWGEKIDEGNLTVKGARANSHQAHNMSLITRIGREKGANLESVKGAMATAIAETSITNLTVAGMGPYYGIFQQTPPTWGSFAQVTDPEYAIAKFYSIYLPYRRKGEDWLTASDHTQRSAYPDAPAEFEEEALKDAEYFWGRQSGTGSGGGRPDSNADGSGGTTKRAVPYEFSRGDADNKGENSWDCMARLGEEVRWRRFMRAGTLWFVSEDWLIHQRPKFKLREFSPGVHEISFNWDTRRGTTPMSSFFANAAEASISFDVKRYGILPGDTIELIKMGVASGKWLATEVNRNLTSPTAEVTLKRFQTKLPEPKRETETVRVNNEDQPIDGGGSGDEVSGAIPGSPVAGQEPHSSTHETSGLPGYPAYDYMAPAGTPCVAPVSGKITRLSGKDPSQGGPPGGALGYSIYMSGGGKSYFLTHLDKVLVKVGQRVKQGEQIAEVADGPSSWSSPHVHMGVSG